ncbi:hypothetical protein E5D57_007631 [Metarhizium anisopliae]|nr:hypothetical protein E5D57_007631 [Metarhizium anisopliae]
MYNDVQLPMWLRRDFCEGVDEDDTGGGVLDNTKAELVPVPDVKVWRAGSRRGEISTLPEVTISGTSDFPAPALAVDPATEVGKAKARAVRAMALSMNAR